MEEGARERARNADGAEKEGKEGTLSSSLRFGDAVSEMKWARGEAEGSGREGRRSHFACRCPTLCLNSEKFQVAEERQVCVSLSANRGDNVHHASFFMVANELPDVVSMPIPPFPVFIQGYE